MLGVEKKFSGSENGFGLVAVWPLAGIQISQGDPVMRLRTNEDCFALGPLDHDLVDPE